MIDSGSLTQTGARKEKEILQHLKQCGIPVITLSRDVDYNPDSIKQYCREMRYDNVILTKKGIYLSDNLPRKEPDFLWFRNDKLEYWEVKYLVGQGSVQDKIPTSLLHFQTIDNFQAFDYYRLGLSGMVDFGMTYPERVAEYSSLYKTPVMSHKSVKMVETQLSQLMCMFPPKLSDKIEIKSMSQLFNKNEY